MEQYVRRNQSYLRCGVTTGSCAAAAAKAAALRLLRGEGREAVTVRTPRGIAVSIPVFPSLEAEDRAEYKVVKDAGDDPDVTDGASIYVCVEKAGKGGRAAETAFSDERYPNLSLDGGDGVGRVTQEGLEQKKGQAAINTVPRSMIFEAVGEVCERAGYTGRLWITVRVPEGEKLALRTFNPQLGIEGGISILGTSGIVEPMSQQALIDTIEAQVRLLRARGEESLLAVPGNYGQRYGKERLHLSMRACVKCGNYIGETLDISAACGIKNFLLVGNIGKLVKLAAGIMNTHSRTADGRWEIFAAHAALCGGGPETARELMRAVHTEEMLRCLDRKGIREAVIKSVCGRIQEHLDGRCRGRMRCGAILFSEKSGFLGQTKQAEALLEKYK